MQQILLMPQYPLDAEVLGGIRSDAELPPSSAEHNAERSHVMGSQSPAAHLVSQVLNPTHHIKLNSFGNQYTVLILLLKMRWRPCSIINSKTDGVYLPAEEKLHVKGRLLGHSSLGHFGVDASSSMCSNGKCSQHSFIVGCTCLSWHIYLKAWESYTVLSNRLSTHYLLPSCLVPKGGSVTPLRGKLADSKKQQLHAISISLLFPL